MFVFNSLICSGISTNRHQRKQNRYVSSAPPRGQYSVLCDQDLNLFESIVGQKNCQTSDLDPYNTDWLKAYKGTHLINFFSLNSIFSIFYIFVIFPV